MSWADQAWYDARWAAVPEEMKRRVVAHLRDELGEEQLAAIREKHAANPEGWALPYHMFAGMGVRNLLREVVRDGELPPAPYPGGEEQRNWDDYYVQALEAAAGVRDA